MRHLSIALVVFLMAVLGALSPGPSAANTPFGSEQIIASDLDRGKGVTAADLDDDGDLDVLTIGDVAARYALNDGNAASWTVVDMPDGGSWREIDALDVDGDGDLDVVVSDWDDGQLIWYPSELDTSGGLGDPQTVCSGCDPDHFEFVDLDGDLDLDFVIAHRAGDTFSWYENVNGDASSWTRHDLPGTYTGPNGVEVDDVDGDGDLDVVGTDTGGSGSLVWFENRGGATSWTPHVVSSGLFVAVLAVDLDFDGDVDFVTQRRNPNHDPPNNGFIDWFENTAGDGSAFTTRTVDSGLTSWGTDVAAVDLDFDGDLDIVGQAVGDWLENVNGDALTWTRRSYEADGEDDLRGTAVADLDRDGDIDILAGRLHRDRASWWPNLRCIESDPDADGDGARDACDRCAGEDDLLDTDGDTIPDGCDVCPIGDDRVDTDDNGVPNACEGEGTLSIDDVTAVETDSGTTTFTFTVTHSGTVDTAFTVSYQTQDDSAEAEGDYASQSGTLAFDGAFGETQTLAVTVQGDTAVEPDETFTVGLGIPTNPDVSVLDGSGLGTIQNDDGASIRIADLIQAEGDSGGTSFVFAVTLDTAVQGGVSVDYATADGTATVAAGDYAATSGTLVFGGTEDEVETVTVTVQGDTFAEDDETFVVALSNVSHSDVMLADDLGQGTLANDDSASVAIGDVSMAEGDSGVTTFTFTVLLAGDVESGFSVAYQTADGSATTSGNDYAAASGTLVFDGTDGDAETVAVDVQGDSMVEADEVFVVLLGTPSDSHVTLGDSIAVGTLLNDDSASVAIGDIAAAEGDSGPVGFAFSVTFTGAVDQAFTVGYATSDGTATSAVGDYDATSGTLSFDGSPGEQETLTVLVNGDTDPEDDETFTVTLDPPSSSLVALGDGTAQGLIANDDFRLSVSVVGSGQVGSAPVGIDCGDGASDCEEIYPAGTVVDLVATPIDGWEFVGWSGAADCDDGTVTLNGDRHCVATFIQGQAQLEVTFAGDGFGIITSMPAGIDCDRDGDPSDCSATFDTGTTVDLAVEVTSVDTTFDGWTGDADCDDGSLDLALAGESVACVAVLTVTPIFADGFESGDTSAWSTVTP